MYDDLEDTEKNHVSTLNLQKSERSLDSNILYMETCVVLGEQILHCSLLSVIPQVGSPRV